LTVLVGSARQSKPPGRRFNALTFKETFMLLQRLQGTQKIHLRVMAVTSRAIEKAASVLWFAPFDDFRKSSWLSHIRFGPQSQ
jgi:hypothetical protein